MINARRVAVLTVGRSDFGRYLPVLRALRERSDIDLQLIASGSHFSARFGFTHSEIDENGFDWEPGFSEDIADDNPLDVGRAIGLGTAELARVFSRRCPDILLVLGDRFEMLSGASAALGFNIPLFHIYGGSVSEGAIDELVRHALTKMSHIHFVSCDLYGKRLLQMGEEPWRVNVTGAPGLDDLMLLGSVQREELSEAVELDLFEPTLLVCYHPVTLEPGQAKSQIAEVLRVVKNVDMQAILTYPNNDPGHEDIIDAIEAFASEHPSHCRVIKNAGTRLFAGLMANCGAMIGNSSSGIVEAATFKLPVVNVGTRQDGKIRAANIIDTGYSGEDIRVGLNTALSADFRRSIQNMVNPNGDGQAGPRIAKIIACQELGPQLLRKKFIDLDFSGHAMAHSTQAVMPASS